jgi:thermitase
MRPRIVLFAVLAAVVLGGSMTIGRPPAARATAPKPDEATEQPRTGDVIVHFKRGATLADVGEALDSADAEAKASTAGSGLVLLEPDAGQSVDAAVAALRADPDVEFAEPDVVLSVEGTPTDPMYASQWSLPQIGLPTAWDTTTGSANVVIAVIDTGVDPTHPDLSGKLVAGYNFVSNNTNTADDYFHGTFVAGIIAANANNGQGMAGACWACKIMPIKVLAANGSGSTFAVSQGIDWAVAHGAKVINLSLGGGGTSSLQTSVDNAWNAGVIVVAASGNDNGPVLYPAAYPNAIAVGSTNQAGARSTYSNWGAQLDLMAPGESVLGLKCTCNGYNGGYGWSSGTSFAAPHVAGVVGLMIAAGITSKTTIVSTLTSTATDMCAPGYDQTTGAGRVNAAKAIAGSNVAVGAVVCQGYGVSWISDAAPLTMSTGTTVRPSITLANAGSMTWQAGGANPVRLSYHWMNGACGSNGSALTFDGQRTNLPANLPFGGSVTLNANIQTPATAGTFCLQFDLIQEGITWFSSQGASMRQKTISVSQSAYGVMWGSSTKPATLPAGSVTNIAASFTNAGSLTWPANGANPVRFSYHWYSGACPAAGAAISDGPHTWLPADVATGGGVTNLAATVTAPATPGTYCLAYDLIREGVAWFSAQSASTLQSTVAVTAALSPTPTATPSRTPTPTPAPSSPSPTPTATAPAAQPYAVTWGANSTPSMMRAGSVNRLRISFTNASTLTWAARGTNSVGLSYHWRANACPGSSSGSWDGPRVALPGDVPPGGTVTSLATGVVAPRVRGTYCLQYDLIQTNGAWFSLKGAATLSKTITVN